MQYKALFRDAGRLTPDDNQWERIKNDFVKDKKIRPFFKLSWQRSIAASLLAALLLTVLWFGSADNSGKRAPVENDLYSWYSDLGDLSQSDENQFDFWLASMESDELWAGENK